MNAPNGQCDLCTLPLRPGDPQLRTEEGTYTFCCLGCRMVFTMLMEAEGETDPARFRRTDLFRRCREMGVIPDGERPARSAPPAERAEPPAPSPREDEERLLPLAFSVGGMWCPACAWVVAEVLERQPGVADARCDFATDRVRGRYDPVRTSPHQLMETVASLGYTPASDPGEARRQARQREFVRFAVSAFLTANVMMLSFALYSGFFTFLPADGVLSISLPSAVLAAGVFFYGGWDIHRRGWIGIFHGAPGMESLISLGSASAFGYSLFGLFGASVHQYFDTAAMLITLTLLGKTLEERAKDRVHRRLGSFFALRPAKVRLCTARWPRGRYVAAGRIRPGDRIAVDDGEVVPADGVVVGEAAAVDESSVTGESRPVTVAPGDRVVSGTRAFGSRVVLRAERVGEDSTLERMIAALERALGQKTAVESRTDRMLRWFVPAVAATAVLSGAAAWGMSGAAPSEALIRAVTVMVIACPCALGIAVPLARVAGLSLAAGSGILVRNFSAFDAAERLKEVVFDKTGTLTHGRWALKEIATCGGFEAEAVLAWAAGLEADSRHPVAVAVRRYATERGIVPAVVESRETAANGVRGVAAGREIRIGSSAYFGGPEALSCGEPDPAGKLRSRVHLSVGGRPAGLLLFGDDVRATAAAAAAALRGRGLTLHLVSGDDPETVARVAAALDIGSAHGGRLPEEKAAFVRELQRQGSVVGMIGDGINDAAALAQSDLAAAVHSRAGLGGETADITLMRGDPAQFPEFLELAVRVRRKVAQNLTFSLVYNVLAIPVAAAGLLTPIVAVCAMLASSLTVIGNTLLLMREGGGGTVGR